jgi:phosphate:Na+ symporter
MEYGFFDVLSLLGALGFFIYGMKVMSEGIQKVAGAKMRSILSSMTSNRFKGVFTGFTITSLVQSSSATTVLVVSFVNAGLLSLTESIGVIMGANIGTTITAWLISIIGFKVKIATYALPIIAFGFPLMFFNRDKLKFWGEVLVGFALLFMGLALLKDSVPDLKSNPEILEFLSRYTDLGYLSIIIFVGIGTLMTVIVQSSSAAMALTLVMANNGYLVKILVPQ